MPKHGDRKENEKGWWTWKQPEGCAEGWWSREEDPKIVESRTPFACPACNEMLDNWSASYYNRWGVCANCYIDFLEGRDNLPEFPLNKDRAAYCREKIAEKKKNSK